MNRDDIIHMAQEIAAQYNKPERFQTWTHDFMMQRLMELVAVSAAAEREACAKVCEVPPSFRSTLDGPSIKETIGKRIAAAIRARGNT